VATAAAMAQQQQAPPQPLPVIPGQAPPNTPAAAQAAPAAQQPPQPLTVIPGQAPPNTPAAAQAAPAAQQPPQPLPVIPGQAPPSTPAAAPAAAAPAPPPATTPAQPPTPIAAPRGLDFEIPNGSLTDFIEIVAKRVGFNYVLDPAVGARGSVSLFTYGETKPTDLLTLLQTILRVNGATMVKVGDIYRIVPINKISALPIEPMVNPDQKALPQDERMILDLIFLKYSTAKEIDTLITPFLGEGASHSIYEPANLLILQDNARNMKRTLQLIDLFDSETFAGQRVKLFDVTYSRPSDLVKELETVFHAYSLSEKSSAVKFIPVDRINTLIAVAPNPGIFPQVQSWIDKLDIAVKVQAGEVSTYVYRMKYARAATTALAITALYTGMSTRSSAWPRWPSPISLGLTEVVGVASAAASEGMAEDTEGAEDTAPTVLEAAPTVAVATGMEAMETEVLETADMAVAITRPERSRPSACPREGTQSPPR
jgi:hypothetical protein